MPPVSMLLGFFCLLICCMWAAAATTTTKKGSFSCVGQPLDTYIADYDGSACREFYLCSRAETGLSNAQDSVLIMSFMCPLGKAFDDRVNDCRNSSDVVCDRRLAASAARTARKVNSTASQKLQQFSGEIKTSFKCAGRKLGSYYSDPETNCTTFHLCTRGEAQNEILNFKFKCLHGEVFEDSEQTCVSYKSDCHSLVAPSTTTTTTTTTTSTTTTTTTTTTPPPPITEEQIVEDYQYDTANASEYDYYDNPETPASRRRRSTMIAVQNVLDINVENSHVVERRQVSSQTSLTMDTLPSTGFTCEGKVPGGHYADIETDCQMYHVCAPGPHGTIQNFRFLCSNGTIFSQQTRTCQAWHTVECGSTSLFYALNEELSRVEPHVTPNQATNQVQQAASDSTFQEGSPSVAPSGSGRAGRRGRKRGKSRRRRPKKITEPQPVRTTTPQPSPDHFSLFDQPPQITIIDPPRTEIQQPSSPLQSSSQLHNPLSADVHQSSSPLQSSSQLHNPLSADVHQPSSPLQSSSQSHSPSTSVGQTSTFDAFIQAALQQEQEQRARLGPILEQKRRQQEAEEQQQRRRQQAEEEQRRQLQQTQEQPRFQNQETEQQRILQQQHEEQRMLIAAEELSRQFEQHAPVSSTSQQTKRRRKRPKSTTQAPALVIPPHQPEVSWHPQDFQPPTITTISPIPTLPQHPGPVEFPIARQHVLPSLTTTAPSVSRAQQTQSQFDFSSVQPASNQHQTPQFSSFQESTRIQTPQVETPQIQTQQDQTSQIQTQQDQAPQFQRPDFSIPQSQTPQFSSFQESTRIQSPQVETSQIQTQQDQTPQFQTPEASIPQSRRPHTEGEIPLSRTHQTPPIQTPQIVPATPQFETQQVQTPQAAPSPFQIPQFPTQQFSIPQHFPAQSPAFQPIQTAQQQQAGFQTQPGRNIESIILQHLKNTQELRKAFDQQQLQQQNQLQQRQQAFIFSPSQPQFSFAQPLGVHSRLIRFESPTSRGFEITSGAPHARFIRSPRQDFKRFKPIAVKLAENLRLQQQQRQHELQLSKFTCKGKVAGGYYADISAGCQMFHICSQGRDESVVYDFQFVCGNWTLFDQRSQTCSAEGKVRCHDSAKYYPTKLFDEPEVTVPEIELLKVRIKRAVQVEKVVQPASNQPNFPSTSFTCDGLLLNRYYGDYETNCQMFHLCTKATTGKLEDHRFLCRNGTVFDERSQACDDQTDALNCIDDPTHYGIGEEIHRQR